MPRTTATPKRAAIYARISKGDEGEGESLGIARQVKDCRAVVAKRRGWTVTEVFTDDDRSAHNRRKPRKGYRQLLDAIGGGQVDVLVIWHNDRLHRQPRELEPFIDLVEATGVAIVSVHGGAYDLGTADGRFRARIEGAVASKESEDKSRRLKAKHAELVTAGHPNGGRRPLGYQRAREVGKDGRSVPVLVPDPDEAPIVAELIERVASGHTLTAIADDLNARGVPTSTGKAWTLWTVRRVATNGLYAGLRVHRGEEVGPGTWPALVDEATWRRAVVILRAPDRAQRRTARRYLLAGGIVRCGKCGGPMRSKPHHVRGGGTVGTYVCPPAKQGGCGGVSIRADALDQLVTEAVVARVESKAFARALRSRTGVDRKAAAEVTRLTRELRDLEDAKASGALSLREYLRFRDLTAEQLGDAQARMTGDTTTAAVGRFAARSGALRAWWDDDATTLDQRQAVVRAVVDRVEVAPVGKRGGKVFDPDRVTVVPVA